MPGVGSGVVTLFDGPAASLDGSLGVLRFRGMIDTGEFCGRKSNCNVVDSNEIDGGRDDSAGRNGGQDD